MPAESTRGGHFERVLRLRQLEFLGELPAADLAPLAEHAHERFYARGTPLSRRDEPATALHVVIAGRVDVYHEECLVEQIHPGGAVGALALLARSDDGLDARATLDTLTLELPGEALFDAMEDRFLLFRHVLRAVSRRIVALTLRSGPANVRASASLPDRVPLHAPQRTLDLVERILLLRGMEPFRRSSVNSLAELARGLHEVRFERDVTLWSTGDPSEHVLLVVDGMIEASASEHGLRFELLPGQPVGNLEGLAELPRWFEARTLTPVLALRGRSDDLLDIFEDNFRMGRDFLAALARLLQRQIERACDGRLRISPESIGNTPALDAPDEVADNSP
jgi:CRP-like cAMP-binding protein